jgi:hypothetical protein
MNWNSPNGSRGLLHVAICTLILLPLRVAPCQAQQSSGVRGVTLTAVLFQSLTVSVTRDTADVLQTPFDISSGSKSPLDVAARWVRGQANVGVAVFAPGNPMLGQHGRAVVPVEITPLAQSSTADQAHYFLSSRKLESNSTHFHFSTGDLQIPEGSEGTLTIRAQAL